MSGRPSPNKSGNSGSAGPAATAIPEDSEMVDFAGALHRSTSLIHDDDNEIDIVEEEGSSSSVDFLEATQGSTNLPFAGNTSFVRRWVDEDDDFDYTRPPVGGAMPSTASPSSGGGGGSNLQRAIGTAPTSASRMPNRKNMWKQRAQQENLVDQSVNLMDADAGTYQDKNIKKSNQPNNNNEPPRRGPGLMGYRQRSLVDIFIGGDSERGAGGGIGIGNQRKTAALGANGGWDDSADLGYYVHGKYNHFLYGGEAVAKRRRWCCMGILAVALLVVMALAVPQFGLVAGNFSKKDDKKEQEQEESTTQEPAQEEQQQHQEPGGAIQIYDTTRPQVTQVEAPDWHELDASSVPQESRVEAIRYHIDEQAVSDPDALDDESSPQYQAIQWLAKEDPAQISIPGYDDDTNNNNNDDLPTRERHLLQQYALAVFYYAVQNGSNKAEVEGAREEEGEQHKNMRRKRNLQDKNEDDHPWVDTAAHDNRMEFDLKWAVGGHVCGWPGVTCNDQDYVTMINVSHSMLEGTLPREIIVGAALPQLAVLDLSHNNLQGPLPFVGTYQTRPSGLHSRPALNAIQQVYLMHNKFNGTLDAIMDWGASLTLIDLTGNFISGAIPHDFALELPHLTVLKVGLNNIQGTLPTEMAAMTKLEILDMERNEMTGTIPREWDIMRSLKAMSLSHCEGIQGEIPHYLAEFNGLVSLRLQGTALKGTIPDFISELTNLSELLLHSTELSGTMPSEICDMFDIGQLGTLTSDCDPDGGTVTCECCTECYRGY